MIIYLDKFIKVKYKNESILRERNKFDNFDI